MAEACATSAKPRRVRHDHSTTGEEGPQTAEIQVGLTSNSPLSIPLHLVMERADGCIKGSQLTLQPITPEDEHGHLALLMLPSPLL